MATSEHIGAAQAPDGAVTEMDAVILVGGRGTRLRPLTVSTPKPMLPTAGYPFLAHLLARIKAAGMNHVVLGTSYKAEVFEEYFGDGSEFGLEIEYVVEEEALGTGGGIRNVYDKLRYDNAMVFNGDVLSGADLSAIATTHVDKDADVTLHLVRVPDPRAFGSVPTDEDGNVLAFLEKTEDPPTDQINAGCYVFKRSVIEQIPAGRVVSVARHVPGSAGGGREGGRPRGFVLLARHGPPGRFRPGVFRCGARHRVLAVARGAYGRVACGRLRWRRARRHPHRWHGCGPRLRDRGRLACGRLGDFRRRDHRAWRDGAQLDYRRWCADRRERADHGLRDRRRGNDWRALRAAGGHARVAGRGNPGFGSAFLSGRVSDTPKLKNSCSNRRRYHM